jgi:hypothetical protein
LRFNPNRKYFTAGDDLIGKIVFKTTVEGQRIEHQGIKVHLMGMVLQMQNYQAHRKSEGTNTVLLDKARGNITAENI